MADSNEREIQRYIRDLPFKARRQLAGAIKTEADRLANAIKYQAPRKTGALAESVKVRRRRNELDLEVVAGGDATTKEIRDGSGVSYDYAMATEFGTSKQPALPFFYSTYRAMRADIERNIETAVRKALDE